MYSSPQSGNEEGSSQNVNWLIGGGHEMNYAFLIREDHVRSPLNIISQITLLGKEGQQEIEN